MLRLTTFPPSCAVVMKSGKLNFWNPLGHSRPVTGLLFLYLDPISEVKKSSRRGAYVSRGKFYVFAFTLLPRLYSRNCIFLHSDIGKSRENFVCDLYIKIRHSTSLYLPSTQTKCPNFSKRNFCPLLPPSRVFRGPSEIYYVEQKSYFH